MTDDTASTPDTLETIEQRVERELTSLREFGVTKKPLPTITMSTFYKLSPRSQMDFVKSGGQLCDDPPAPKKPLSEGTIRRSTFDAMEHGVKRDFIRNGGRLVDDEDVDQGSATESSEITDLKRKLKIIRD